MYVIVLHKLLLDIFNLYRSIIPLLSMQMEYNYNHLNYFIILLRRTSEIRNEPLRRSSRVMKEETSYWS
ncbi:hypothetical protein RIF29_35613 [Crotalaria pallida]|uniref:Uncharacterized protein n=1 Tax=Crotalaria pallida TaxID=3830 RepID=A0AAN9ECE3_CROPI